jgi:SET domain-containing protein
MKRVAPKESWLNPKIAIRGTDSRGQGMFALEPIETGESILVFGGEYVNAETAKQAKTTGKLVMQWDDDLFSVEDRGADPTYFINHSCDPNAWMEGAFTIVAKRDVEAGEELTIDYALWEADENYVSSWECHCGSARCRKRVTGKDWRLPELQERYKGHFTPLINKRIGV